MKKLFLVTAILITLTGCAWMGKQIDYQKACLADPACKAAAQSDASLAQTIVGTAFPVAGGAAGAVALIISLWFRGKKKEETK